MRGEGEEGTRRDSPDEMEPLRRRVAPMLRVGLVLGALSLLVALCWLAAGGVHGLTARTGPVSPATLADILTRPSAAGFALLGALILVATPLGRVALSLEFFASVRDRAFVAITLFVLAMLATTVAVGLAA